MSVETCQREFHISRTPKTAPSPSYYLPSTTMISETPVISSRESNWLKIWHFRVLHHKSKSYFIEMKFLNSTVGVRKCSLLTCQQDKRLQKDLWMKKWILSIIEKKYYNFASAKTSVLPWLTAFKAKLHITR